MTGGGLVTDYGFPGGPRVQLCEFQGRRTRLAVRGQDQPSEGWMGKKGGVIHSRGEAIANFSKEGQGTQEIMKNLVGTEVCQHELKMKKSGPMKGTCLNAIDMYDRGTITPYSKEGVKSPPKKKRKRPLKTCGGLPTGL